MVNLRFKKLFGIFRPPAKGFLAILIAGCVLSLNGFLSRLFPLGIDEFEQQLIYSLSAGIFFLGLWLLSTVEGASHLNKSPSELVPSIRVQCCIILLLFLFNTINLISRFNEHHLGEIYITQSAWTLILLILIILMAGEIFLKWSLRPVIILTVSCFSYLLLIYYDISLTPLSQSTEVHSVSSFKAIQRFFVGLDPYQVFDKSTSGPFTHLPGFWLTFVPSWLTGIDPRWTNRIAVLVAAIFTYFGTHKHNRLTSGYLMACFLMIPYHLFDNSTFMGLLCAFSAITFFCLSKKLYLFAAAVLGLSMTVSLFFWLFVPFALVILFKKQPVYLWILEVSILGAFAATLLLPFWWFYPESFLYCTVEVWGDTVVRNGFNVAYWLDPLVGRYGMGFLQLVLFAIFFFSFVKRESALSGYYIYTSFFAFFFLLLNHVVNTYVFPAVFLMMVFGVSVQISSQNKEPKQSEGEISVNAIPS